MYQMVYASVIVYTLSWWMFFHFLTGLMNARYLPCHWKVLRLLGMNGWLLFRRPLFLLYFKVDFSVLFFYVYHFWIYFMILLLFQQIYWGSLRTQRTLFSTHFYFLVFSHFSSFYLHFWVIYKISFMNCRAKHVAYIFLSSVSEPSIIYIEFLCTPLQKPI